MSGQRPGPQGIAVVDKPAGMTSHAVVAHARRVLDTRKIGHAGTLDPMATGVLVLGVGRATRMLGWLAATTKAYEATIALGVSTLTDDADGEVTGTTDTSSVDDVAIVEALAAMRGTIDQVPSSVSAVKIDGKRAYARVRAGEQPELAPRTVTISQLAIDDHRRLDGRIEVDITVECSAGTYIRAIARDLGVALGVGGHLASLRRTRAGAFTLADAIALDALAPDSLMSMAQAAQRAFTCAVVDDVHAVRHGRQVPWPDGVDTPEPGGVVALLAPDGGLLALARRGDRGQAEYVAVFDAP